MDNQRIIDILVIKTEFVSGPHGFSENSDFGLIEVMQTDGSGERFSAVVAMPFSARPNEEILVTWYMFKTGDNIPPIMLGFVERKGSQ